MDPEVLRARRRRVVVSGLVLFGIGALIAASWWLVSREDGPVEVAEQSRMESTRETGSPPSPVPDAAAEPPPPVSAPPPARIPEDRSTLPPEIQRYLAAHEYPPFSGVLRAGAIDLLQPNRRFEREKPVPGSSDSDTPDSFLWTADRLYYTGGDTVFVRFEAHRAGQPAPMTSLEATAEPEGGAGPIGSRIPLTLLPDGDAFVGSLPLVGSFGGHHGPIALTATYQLEGGRLEEERIRVFTTPAERIPARFTGSHGERVEAGSLVVEAGIDVTTAGFFRIDANLRDASGEPVAWGHWKGQLDEKSGFVPIAFFGKVLLDAGVPGPYQVTELRGYRFLDGQFPDRERMRDADTPFLTRAIDLAELSDAPYESEHLARMVELLQQDLDAGLTIDVPPDAGPPAAPKIPSPSRTRSRAPGPENRGVSTGRRNGSRLVR